MGKHCCLRTKVSDGGARLHPSGVLKGVHKWPVVRVTRCARNSKSAALCPFCVLWCGRRGVSFRVVVVMSGHIRSGVTV